MVAIVRLRHAQVRGTALGRSHERLAAYRDDDESTEDRGHKNGKGVDGHCCGSLFSFDSWLGRGVEEAKHDQLPITRSEDTLVGHDLLAVRFGLAPAALTSKANPLRRIMQV